MDYFSFTYFSVFALIYFANLSWEHSNISLQTFVPAFFSKPNDLKVAEIGIFTCREKQNAIFEYIYKYVHCPKNRTLNVEKMPATCCLHFL